VFDRSWEVGRVYVVARKINTLEAHSCQLCFGDLFGLDIGAEFCKNIVQTDWGQQDIDTDIGEVRPPFEGIHSRRISLQF